MQLKVVLQGTMLVAVGTAVGIFVAEVGLRVFAPQITEPHPQGLYVEDEDLGFRLSQNVQGRSVSPEWDVDVRTNPSGLRGEALKPKNGNARRILFLGDSFTFGVGVEVNETYISRVDEGLREAGILGLTSVNGGVPGYGSVQSILLFDRIHQAVQPDAVVLGFFENDFFDNVGGNQYRVIDGYLVLTKSTGTRLMLTERIGIPPSVKIWLRTRSHLFIAAMNSWTSAMMSFGLADSDNRFDIFRSEQTEQVAQAIRATEDALVMFSSTCERLGISCGVVYLPDARIGPVIATELGIDRGRPASILEGLVKVHNLPFLDLTPSFENAEGLFFPEDGHWNAAGHAVAGHTIAEALVNGSFPLLPRLR